MITLSINEVIVFILVFIIFLSFLKIEKCYISNRLLPEMTHREKDSIYLKKWRKLSSSTEVLNLFKIED
jgi:hypothetical protein